MAQVKPSGVVSLQSDRPPSEPVRLCPGGGVGGRDRPKAMDMLLLTMLLDTTVGPVLS